MAAIIQASVTSLAWVCAASFGVPVVPPVWKSAARSVADGRLTHEAVVWLLRRQRGQVADPHAVDSGAAPPRPRCPRSGLGRAAPRSRPRRRGLGRCPRRRARGPGRRRPGPGRRTCAAARRCARRERPLLIGAAMPASSAARVAVMSSSQFGASRATPSVRRTPERVEHVGVAVHVGQQLGEGPLRRLLPPVAVGQHGQGDPVRPQARRPGRGARTSCPAGHGRPAARPRSRRGRRARRTSARGGRPSGRALTTVRCRPRSIAPSSVPMATSTTSPCLRYLGFWACRWKKSFHFSAGGRNAAMISTGFGGALRAVPTGVPVRSRSPGSSRWNRLSACSASQRGVDHVAVDHRVLAQLAVDPQAQAQVAEPLELVVVEQDQRRVRPA